MSKQTWLLIDVPNIFWRAYHTTGEMANGSTFGFLRELQSLQRRFMTERLAFCFDSCHSKRKGIYPAYKGNRKQEESGDELKGREHVREEMRNLAVLHLPTIGYKNVFLADGYEADDLIASLVKHSILKGGSAVMVSSDRDLWQLLDGKRVTQWNPVKKELMTEVKFRKDWHGLDPHHWVSVKSIAGCKTDNVKGIDGVGEITAAKYVAGKLVQKNKAYDKIDANLEQAGANAELIQLPFAGCPKFTLVEDRADPQAWRQLTKELGFSKLTGGF